MAIFNFQLSYESIQKLKNEVKERNIAKMRLKYQDELLEKSESLDQSSVDELIDRHNQRINSFLTELHNTRCKNFEKIAASTDS